MDVKPKSLWEWAMWAILAGIVATAIFPNLAETLMQITGG